MHVHMLFYLVNFCVSGVAVQWYFRKDIQLCYPLKAFITKHFGSVAGGSFLRSFMFIPHFFVDLFCNHKDACCCNCCDLPRGDAYPYLYMTSASYCPSVRQAQYLCKRSDISRGNQSTNFYYSLAARLVLALSSTLIAYWILQSNMYHSIVNPYVLLGTFLYLSTFGFINFDIYNLGYLSSIMLLVFSGLILFLIIANRRLGYVWLLALVAFYFKLQSSNNFWDYLYDPLLWLVLLVDGLSYIMGISFKKRAILTHNDSSIL